MAKKREVDKKLYGWKPVHMVNGVPWPRLDLMAPTGIDVPLKEKYLMRSMDYLDTPQAREIFEVQAKFLRKKSCKGIVDVGCRTGPVNEILHEWGYTDYRYMGFDTSPEPIEYSQQVWKNLPSIEYRCTSWDNLEDIRVDFTVDCVIWSGVLLYRPNDHLEFFHKISKEFYNAKYALIQEPMKEQKHWVDHLNLRTVADELPLYKERYTEYNEVIVDAEVFCGRRKVVELEL